jgi:two-component system sensor histidine kinase DesK
VSERAPGPPSPSRLRRVRAFACGFVAFLGYPAAELAGLGLPGPVAVAAAAGLVAFGGLFVWVIWHNVPRPRTAATPYALAAMAALAVALQFALRGTWLITASFYLVTLAVLVLPPRRWPLALAAFWAGHVALAVGVLGRPFGAAALTGAGIALYGAACASLHGLMWLATRLRAARAELARAAITAERLRIARDLHDTLGRRLTEVVLRSELAARLVDREPERAAAEMREVGRGARELLAEVRATVSGYREADLDSELATAREIARAAGITLTVSLPPDPPPPSVAAVAAWVVREGVTNVLRHSVARACAVTVAEEDGGGPGGGRGYTVTVADDGPALGGRPVAEPGAGLTGLTERLAAAGGELSIEVDKEWFMLRARIPEVAA